MSEANLPDPKPAPGTLPRVLGPFDAITIVVGSIIGSGVFLKAATIAEGFIENDLSPSFGPIIAVWIIVGLVTLCGALALGELAAMLPQAGGPYVYLREAYGRLPAFLWGWTEFWIIRTGSLGSLACATIIYFNKYLILTAEGSEWLRPLVPLGAVAQCALAIALVVVLTVVNVVGTRWGARVQNVTTVVKVGFLLFLIFAPFVMRQANVQNLSPIWPDDISLSFWKVLGLAMIAVMWPYDGWINVAQVAEEIRHPQRNVPLALTVGMFVVIGVYVGANLSYHLVLPMDRIATSGGVASDVCQVMFGTLGGQLAAVGVMCSTFGAINSNLLTGPRIYFAMARDRLFPAALCRVHDRFQTPANAILAQTAWAVVLIVIAFTLAPFLPKSTPKQVSAPLAAASDAPVVPAKPFDARPAFDALTDFVIFGGSIFYALAVGAVFRLRFTRPNLPRPYRTWGYPVTPALYLLAFSGVLVSLLVKRPWQSAAGVTLILVGVGVYFVVLSIQKRDAAPEQK